MNRCLSVLLSLFLCAAALAQDQLSAPLPVDEQAALLATPGVRKFPAHAVRGKLRIVQSPDILLDGKPARLSPGSRIRDTQQRLVMPAGITGQDLIVAYVRHPLGEVHEVWILNELEAKQMRKNNEPRRKLAEVSAGPEAKHDDGKTPFHLLPTFDQLRQQQNSKAMQR